jgi:hypothetical protein
LRSDEPDHIKKKENNEILMIVSLFFKNKSDNYLKKNTDTLPSKSKELTSYKIKKKNC